MKENKYDDDVFFEQYSLMDRSVNGLKAAGEWHLLKNMLPDFKDKRVLDLGCGFGWHCQYAAEHGARSVLGLDISEKMLERAKQKTTFSSVHYIKSSLEDMDFLPDSFDVVISSLVFHYSPSFSDICQKVYHCLSAKGDFVFSVEHPIFTASGTQGWHYDEEGKRLHWPVDRYFEEGKRDAVFLGESVIKYHKTLTTYINGLLKTGFVLKEFIEAMPSEEQVRTIPGMADELRRPMMLLISASKA